MLDHKSKMLGLHERPNETLQIEFSNGELLVFKKTIETALEETEDWEHQTRTSFYKGDKTHKDQ